jgi:hypothetical protein
LSPDRIVIHIPFIEHPRIVSDGIP